MSIFRATDVSTGLVFPLVLFLLSGYSLGATDGAVGPTSSATIGIHLQVSPVLQAETVAAVALGPENHHAETAICVYPPTRGRYQLRVAGSGPGQSFALDSGTAELPYLAQLRDGQQSYQLLSGVPLTSLESADSLSSRCQTQARAAELALQLSQIARDPQVGATYTGTLTLTIAPD